MKSFFTTLLVVCGIFAAVWYFYDPYLKPLLEGDRSDETVLSDDDSLVTDDAPGEKPETAPKTSRPDEEASEGAAEERKVAETDAPEPKKTKLDRLLEERYPMPEILPLMEIVNDWQDVPQRAFPREVTLEETISFDLVVNGQEVGSSDVAPGTPLQPVKLAGNQLTIANPANPAMSKQVDVEKTDFKERIRSRYEEFVEAKRKEVKAMRDRVRKIVEADPSKMALLTGEGAASSESGDEARFAPVKRSLRNGEAASVKLEEAKSFRWNGEEKVGGEYAGAYETVTVNFEVSTIFGEFPVEYKALLRGGEVVAWIDPLTEERI